MKILFLTDNFPPEFNAPASRTYEHCKEWVKQGTEVTVITCFPNFPKGEVFGGYKNKWRDVEIKDGIRIIRVWSYITPNTGTFRRTLDFLSFAFTAFLSGLWVKTDLIIATSPQFFTAVSGCLLGLFKGKKWVMEVRDLWPESIKAVEAVNNNWIISVLEKLELFLYKNAYRIIVVTDSFRKILIERNINPNKICVIKNGVDISLYKPEEKSSELLQKLELNGKFIVGYVGTHGLAHSLGFIIQSISKVQNNAIHFIFIGDGAEKNNIMDLAKELGLTNVTFLNPVQKSEIKKYLSVLDVALVPLKRSPTFESVIPSKVFEAVAMNIPILLGVDGEARNMVESYQAGVYFEPENEKDFLSKLKLIHEVMNKDRMSFNEGCQKMAFDFDRRNLAKKMLDIIIQ